MKARVSVFWQKGKVYKIECKEALICSFPNVSTTQWQLQLKDSVLLAGANSFGESPE